MNKEESLAFLQNCIEKLKRATAQDIQFYKEVYDRECDPKERMSEIKFVFPTNNIEYRYEVKDSFELDMHNNMKADKKMMEYSFLDTSLFNQEIGDNLPYAA